MYLRPTGDATRWSDWQPGIPFNPPAAPEGFEWMPGDPPGNAAPYTKADPLAGLATMVRALPVEKRINTAWGQFMVQCVFALQPPDGGEPDLLSFAGLINGFETEDVDYLAILNTAKQQFGI